MDISSLLLWLVPGAVLQLLGFGRWMTPLAPWLAPIFLLHFMHAAAPLPGFLLVWLALFSAIAISMRGIVPIPGLAYLLLPISTGLFGALPYVADRAIAPLLEGVPATLVFPVTLTALEFLNARLNPYGTWGTVGYTQHGVLPLMQLSSVGGMWGIGFLMGWFASLVNLTWGKQFAWEQVHDGVVWFCAITGLIILLGGLRLALARRHETVRVAGIGWPKGIIEPGEFMRAVEPTIEPEECERLNHHFRIIQNSFLERSVREAKAGAKIVVWPEANLIVFEDEEAAFLERARALARDHGIYLLMGMATLYPGKASTFRNHAVLLNPAGKILYDYTKLRPVPGFEKRYGVAGEQPLPVVDTEYGRIGTAICFDMDFAGVVRQLGRQGADIALIPASDWKEIMPLHQQMAEFRAVENGVALFRITRWGSSGAVDPYGRVLATMDDFAAADNVMVAQLPTKAGVRTLYARIGDLFGWLCTAGLAAYLLLLAMS